MKNCIVPIKCGTDVGTAFYISRDTLLTAYHTIATRSKDDEITIVDSKGMLKGIMQKELGELDLALIKVDGRQDSTCLQLAAHKIRIKENFFSYGYPDQFSEDGFRVEGYASDRCNESADVKMHCNSVSAGVRYDGMSGAPVIKDNVVCGVIIEQIGQDVKFISIFKAASQLKCENVEIQSDKDITFLPSDLQMAIDNSQPNFSVFSSIDKSLENKGKWHLLYGSPGCGKTTLAASYIPEDENWVVLGRFFLKVPADTISSAERCSNRYFIDWLESVYINNTYADVEIMSVEKKLQSVPAWMEEIASQFKLIGKNGVIIVDGLDELVAEGDSRVSGFTRILDFDMPDNITVLLSCTSKDILPTTVIRELPRTNCIEVTALDMVVCEQYIANNTGDWDKPYSFIQEIAHKTGGHPLYMNYLCKYVVTEFDKDTKEEILHEWTATLPSISGNIETYYNAIWQKINANGAAVELLAVLSQIRGHITEDELTGMISAQNIFSFSTHIEHLRFLLKSQEKSVYELYHSSFNIFLSAKLPKRTLLQTNDQISTFCQQNPASVYTIENELHHKLCGTDVISGLKLCNQDWADKCAKLDLSPDQILHDIRECLSKAVDECLPIEVARLMLLAQRIEFRYDIMLVSFASTMADINIALRKPDAALRYLIRENNLLIDEMEGIKYLQQMYDAGFIEQAHTLYEAVEAKCRQRLHAKEGESISIKPFLAIGEAQVEYSKEDQPDGEQKLFNIYKKLNRLRHKFKSDEDNFKSMTMVQSLINSYLMASDIRCGHIPNFDFILGYIKCNWSKDFTAIGFRALYYYQEMNSYVSYKPKASEYYQTLTLLEQKIEKHKIQYTREELYLLLSILIADSKKSELTKELIAQYNPSDEVLFIRKPSGVDINWEDIVAYNENLRYIGYADDNDNYPHISEEYWNTEKYWEKYIVTLLKRIAYLQGHLCRKKADSKDINNDYFYLKDALDKLSFSFETRSQWNRSYQIPEGIIPFIYANLATLYRDFYPGRIDEFMTHVDKRTEHQLSLYREGYVETMFNIIDRFTEKQCFQNETKILVDKLRTFVVYGVLNRYERTPNLLKLVHRYAVLGDQNNADAVYQEMLNTSMGPSWYKEAQMSLLNNLADYGMQFTADQAISIATIFDAAAGEMTFQRYVQQEQNEFIGNLTQASSLEDAVAYYKYETLPSYEVVVHNAEDWNVDMPKTGHGYNLGANHLIEASAMRYLLNSTQDASPYIIYALSELFWDNDDNFRYGEGYALIHKLVFEKLGNSVSISELVPRMAKYFVNNNVGKHEDQYLNALVDNCVNINIIDALQKEFQIQGFAWKRKQKEVPEKREDTSRKAILRKTSNIKEILLESKKSIVNPLSEYWYSLNELLDVIIDKMTDDTEQLCNVILNHLDLVVRPSDENKQKFVFIQGYKTNEDKGSLLVKFLIWFIIHPDCKIAFRAKEILVWLAKYESTVIKGLIDEIMNPSEVGIATTTSELLIEITKAYPQKVVDELQILDNIETLSNIQNLSVSRNLYEIGLKLNVSLGYCNLVNAMNKVIPDKCEDKGDVFFENKDIIYIEHYIDKLNNLHVLDGTFARQYLNEVRQKEKIVDLINSDEYVRRSFSLDRNYNCRYKHFMMDVINRYLHGTIDKARLDRVYYAINL